MRQEAHRATSEHNAATLNGFDEVFGALGNKTEAGLVCVEFKNAAQRLLGHYGEIVGIIEEYPGRGAGNGANTAHEVCEPLSDRGDPAIISTGETECHRCMIAFLHPLTC